MQIITECNLAQIVSELLNGKTLVFPTETSYGLGCDATNQEAVDRIFKIKGRRNNKPLLVVVPTVEMARRYVMWNELLEKIASKYWPGAVTVVGEYLSLRAKRSNLPVMAIGSESRGIATSPDANRAPRNDTLVAGVVSQDNTLAIRVTAHPLLKSITEKLGRPLVATSGNIADTGDIYTAAEIIAQFENREVQPDIILNYGELPRHKPTTIVSAVSSKLEIIRQGEVVVQ